MFLLLERFENVESITKRSKFDHQTVQLKSTSFVLQTDTKSEI